MFSSENMSSTAGKRKEIYKYLAPWPLYSMNWSVRPDKRFRLALGRWVVSIQANRIRKILISSFIEEYNNKVQIISLDEETSEFTAKSTFDHPYPTTKIMWIPDSKGIYTDLLATSGDYLRVWRAGETETQLQCVLNNNKNSDFCAPLTSFDWNEVDPNLVGTSSIDTTCTIWGLETGQVSFFLQFLEWFFNSIFYSATWESLRCWSRQNSINRTWQGSLRHCIFKSRRRTGHVCFGWCWRFCTYVRSKAFGALDNYLRGEFVFLSLNFGSKTLDF